MWLKKYKRVWRVSILVLMMAAFLGPWMFDQIHVPAKYPCSPPHYRLEGDFCGRPVSGLWLFPGIVGFIFSGARLVTGGFVFTEWIRDLLFSVFVSLPLLPIFGTLLLILRGDHRRRQIFTIVAWVLAIGVSLFSGLNNYPKLFWLVWGVWLYIGLAASALILETLVLRAE